MGLFWSAKDERIVLLEERVEELKAELAQARDVATHPLFETLSQTIAYLKEQLAEERALRLAEREEYKRAVDRLIEQAGGKPVGQTAPVRKDPPVEFDLNKALSIFTYEKDAGSGEIRQLGRPEELI